MRYAYMARKDAQNILEERFTELTKKITNAIEQAVADGRFKTIVCFDKDISQAAKDHMISKLRAHDYKANFTSYREECSLEVSW